MCNYCAPDEKGRRKVLDSNQFMLNHETPRIKRNVLKIYRERNKKKQYFIGIHSKDLCGNGLTLYRNNGFIMKRHINYCPMCGRNLKNLPTGATDDKS